MEEEERDCGNHSQDRGNCYCHDLTIRRQHSSVKTYFFLYVDEFLHDELKDSFIRIVRGCWIEEENRLSSRDVYMKGRDLQYAKYTHSLTQSFTMIYYTAKRITLHSHYFVDQLESGLSPILSKNSTTLSIPFLTQSLVL